MSSFGGVAQVGMDISLKQVGKTFFRTKESFPALHCIDLLITAGEFVSLVGPTGCGKTTLLRLVGGLLEPTAGSISIGGGSPEEARSQGRFSFVFQNPCLLPWRTVRGNVELPSEILGKQQQTVSDLLALVGLEQFSDFYPKELSGGMKQRVALARSLSYRPSILLMDEPFGALDEQTRHRLNEELLGITRPQNLTVIFVTHSIPEAVFLGDRVIVLSSPPASIREIFMIDFPAPRTRQLREEPEFHRKASEIRRALE